MNVDVHGAEDFEVISRDSFARQHFSVRQEVRTQKPPETWDEDFATGSSEP